jgi:photosystem II stability/assembly factor-like uncharacterized protein
VRAPLRALAAAGLAAALAAPSPAARLDSAELGAMRARAIGPAVFGGRIEAIDGSKTNPRLIYIGAAGGGVWRSLDGGVTFKAVFDKYSQSIGAVTIDQAHPDTVWVGTGESDTRNTVSIGTGIYKTTDGGDDWQLMGLANSERIARIVVDPTDSNRVLAAVVGHLWNDSPDRGLYETTDGGKTWRKILYVGPSTGCADVAMDPSNPKVLYAAMWDFRRWPYFFRSGGPGSGLFKSSDGGASWTKLANGLPKGELGRIAVAVAPSHPATVYATVESEKTALYRSDDAGATWRRLDSSFNITVRPFYFSHLAVDPTNPERVYKPGFTLSISEDGGRSFSGGIFEGGGYHGDTHAIWIDPGNPDHLLLGTDGGVYASWDRGGKWMFLRSLPVSQPYRVAFDEAQPYDVYGGFQDNGSWYGPTSGPGGIGNDQWKNFGFGDGMYAFPDPTDADLIYWELQGGEIYKTYRKTKEIKKIRPYPGAGDKPLRFNWEAPLVLSPADPHRLYTGAQYLFLSTDRGESWSQISGDLTTDNPAYQRQVESGGLTPDDSSAENHCTIYAIAPSPLDPNLIWIGTDDGNLQLSRDGGAHWENVVAHVPNLPKGTWVSGIAASRFAPGTAYATFDDHARGDMAPYVYVTTDFGATWTSLVTPDIEGYAHVIREDLKSPRILYLGTEMGLFLSIDGGQNWAQFTGNLPKVPVRDIAIQPRESDLILATHGRGFYVVDDVSVLRQLTPEVLDSDVTVLQGRPTYLRLPSFEQAWNGDGDFVGDNPTEAAVVYFYRKKRRLIGQSKIEIHDASGKLIATLPGSNRRGINRVVWNTRLKPPRTAAASALAFEALEGPTAPVGDYTVQVLDGSKTYTGRVTLAPDPLLPHSRQDVAARQDALMQLYRMQEDLAYLVDSVTSVRDQARDRARKLGRSGLSRELSRLADGLDALHQTLVTTHPPLEGTPADADRQLREWIVDLYGAINGYGGRPTPAQTARLPVLSGELSAAGETFQRLCASLPKLNARLGRDKLAPIGFASREQWDKKP